MKYKTRAMYPKSRFRSHCIFFIAVLLTVCGCQSEPDRVTTQLNQQNRKRLKQAQRALHASNFDRASKFLDTVESRVPNSPDAAFLRGRLLTATEQYEQADSAYRRSLRLKPGYRGAWNNMADNAYRQARYERAIRLYKKELGENPAARPWRGIGRSYVQLDKIDSARYAFERAIEMDSSFAGAYHSLALLEEDEGNFAQALQYAQRARKLNPKDMQYHYLVGSLLVSLGRHKEAVPYLRHVCKEWPWYSSAHYKLGQALIRSGRTTEGKKYIAESEKLRKQQQKVDYYAQRMKVNRNNPIAHAQYASALRKVGRLKEAMAAYQTALRLDPDNLAIRRDIALLYLVMGNEEQAIEGFRQIVQKNPESPNVWVTLGILYARSGAIDKATQMWKRALQYDPEHTKAKAYLARVKDGQWSEENN